MSGLPEDTVSCPHCHGKYKRRGLANHIRAAHNRDKSQDVQSSQSADQNSDFSAFLSLLSKLKKNVKIIKRIPKALRSLIADHLSKAIKKCISENNVQAWQQLFLFTYKCLRKPNQEKGISLVSQMKNNVWKNEIPTFDENRKFKSAPLEKRVEQKLADHDIRGAVKLISSSDSFALFTPETFEELLKKHPLPSRPLEYPPPPDDSTSPITVLSSDVLSAILSFPNGSSVGIDALRPQNLKDLTSFSAGDSGVKLLDSLTKLCNFLLQGKLIQDFCPVFYGASLCALEKKRWWDSPHCGRLYHQAFDS